MCCAPIFPSKVPVKKSEQNLAWTGKKPHVVFIDSFVLENKYLHGLAFHPCEAR